MNRMLASAQPNHRNRRPRLAALGLLATLLVHLAPPAVSAAGDKVDLKPQWKVGQRMVQQVRTTQTQKITVAGTPMEQNSKQLQEVVMTVDAERPEGGFEVGIEFLSMMLETKMGETVIVKYDSKDTTASSGANPIAAVLGKLVGAKFKMLTKPDGEVEKVEGVEEVIAGMASSMPEMIGNMIKSMFNEGMVKQMSAVPQGLPTEPVAPGHEWPVTVEMSMGPMGTLVVSMDFEFTGMERKRDYDCAVFDHKGFISNKEGSGEGPVNIGSVSGTTSGRTWYAPSIGATVDAYADQKMKMSMKAMGQDANIDIDSRVTNKLLEITGAAK